MKMRTIHLTKGQFVQVDDRDYEFLNQWKWRCNGHYAVRTITKPKRYTILMHRLILECMGNENFELSDHINGDKLDNRRVNLRPATRSQNMWNSRKQVNNTSGAKGVTKHQGKWRADIGINGKRRYLGHFDSVKAAAAAYSIAAKELYGEFARAT